MPPRALILDFDGVIADTENHHIAAWQETFARMGWEVDDEVCARAAEIDDRVFLTELFASRKIVGGDVEGWTSRKQATALEMLAASPRIYPGVVELIERVKKQGSIKLAVVTSTWRDNVTAVLRAAGLLDAFSLIVAKEDVKRTKPDPSGYRSAVASLAVDFPNVVALEDSPSGLTAAHNAGVHVIAVGHRRPRGDWVGNAPFLSDLRKTDEVFKQLGLTDS